MQIPKIEDHDVAFGNAKYGPMTVPKKYHDEENVFHRAARDFLNVGTKENRGRYKRLKILSDTDRPTCVLKPRHDFQFTAALRWIRCNLAAGGAGQIPASEGRARAAYLLDLFFVDAYPDKGKRMRESYRRR